MKIKLQLLFAMTLLFLNAQGSIVTVPGTFNSIQEAINASANGDTVVVTPGTYYENINFRGKNIVVTSLFYLSADTGYISTTIINGSNPLFPDTASCVIFNSAEDSTAVLQGFTITGGAGTKWLDIHGAGLYREGGGILIELSSPTIKYNVITGNYINDLSGVISTGGGGIRIGDGDPTIKNNIISFNQARYGAGIVLNYTGCKILNNVIVSNSGGQDYYGGSGIWILNNLSTTPKIIENNTIANNYSAAGNGTGGISTWSAANVLLKNNIIYGNLPAQQIKTISSAPQVSYCNVQGGYAGTDNINTDPLFASTGYLLQPGSPCVDGGDMQFDYNDIEDIANPGNALFPSYASLRNDIGAYGGPGAFMLPLLGTSVGINEAGHAQQFSLYPNPVADVLTIISETGFDNATLRIFDNIGKIVHVKENVTGLKSELQVDNLPTGFYHVTIQQADGMLLNGMFIKP